MSGGEGAVGGFTEGEGVWPCTVESPMNRMTDMTENITLLSTPFAGGKKQVQKTLIDYIM